AHAHITQPTRFGRGAAKCRTPASVCGNTLDYTKSMRTMTRRIMALIYTFCYSFQTTSKTSLISPCFLSFSEDCQESGESHVEMETVQQGYDAELRCAIASLQQILHVQDGSNTVSQDNVS
ncbi:hypothetical protein NDU88_000624, partial [Pleurodeles waltl]